MTVYSSLLCMLSAIDLPLADADVLRRAQSGLSILDELGREQSSYYPNISHAISELTLLEDQGKVLIGNSRGPKGAPNIDAEVTYWVNSIAQAVDKALAPGPILVIKTMHLAHGVREHMIVSELTTVKNVADHLLERHSDSIRDYIIRNSHEVPDSGIHIDIYCGAPDEVSEPRQLDPEMMIMSLVGFGIDGIYWWPHTTSPLSSLDEDEDEDEDELNQQDYLFEDIDFSDHLLLDPEWRHCIGLLNGYIYSRAHVTGALRYVELVVRVVRAYTGTRLDISGMVSAGILAVLESVDQNDIRIRNDDYIIRRIKEYIQYEVRSFEGVILVPSEDSLSLIDVEAVAVDANVDDSTDQLLDAIRQLPSDQNRLVAQFLDGGNIVRDQRRLWDVTLKRLRHILLEGAAQ